MGVLMREQEREWVEWREREREIVEMVERMTRTPGEEQDKTLSSILERNAKTEYLLRHGLNGRNDVETFRKCVPVVEYDAFAADIERMANGDKSPILFASPATEFLKSSGTTGGVQKLFPTNDEDSQLRTQSFASVRPMLNRALPGLEKGKVMFFYFTRSSTNTSAGLPAHAAVSSFMKSPGFMARPFDPSYDLTSPDEVSLDYDNDAAMYGHFLCGLIQRNEVKRLGAIFAAAIIRSLKCLSELFPDLCDDIAAGTVNTKRISSASVREAILRIHNKPNVELAEFVRSECSKKSWDGIIQRLWPNVMVIDTVVSGSMAAYIPILQNYSGDLPIICAQMYGASEGFFGINIDPLVAPTNITYMLLPNVAFYEFLPLASHESSSPDSHGIVDLVDVQVGREYEVVITTVAGLYRYRLGDILRVERFYNSTPMFRVVGRANVLLSVDTDKTDEAELSAAVTKAARVMENAGMELVDYTSVVDLSTNPGHYVIFWELQSECGQEPENISSALLEECCAALEATLGAVYRRGRNEDVIGPLELRLLKAGTFDLIATHILSNGGTLAQYKTPRGLKNPKLLSLVTSQVTRKHFSQTVPPEIRISQ